MSEDGIWPEEMKPGSEWWVSVYVRICSRRNQDIAFRGGGAAIPIDWDDKGKEWLSRTIIHEVDSTMHGAQVITEWEKASGLRWNNVCPCCREKKEDKQ